MILNDLFKRASGFRWSIFLLTDIINQFADAVIHIETLFINPIFLVEGLIKIELDIININYSEGFLKGPSRSFGDKYFHTIKERVKDVGSSVIVLELLFSLENF